MLLSKCLQMRFFIYFCILISSCSYSAFAQVLDDSTKQIYSTKTVKFVYESDLLKNRKSEFNPDTLLSDFKQMVFPIALNQDLGNIGTATFEIVAQANKNLFLRPRFGVFDRFKKTPETIRYFNTKSPYTELDYIQGNRGFSKLNFIHSQNINSRLNVTLDVEKFNSSKQYGTNTAEEKLVDHWSYSFSSNYSSKNNKFKLLAAIVHFNHVQNEQGGILEKENVSIKPSDLETNYKTNYQVQLTAGTYNREKQNLLHLYGQYVLKQGIQVFAKLDIDAQKYILLDPNFGVHDSLVYKNINFIKNLDTLGLNSKFLGFSNTFGFKGRYKAINYDAYAKYRISSYKNITAVDPRIYVSSDFKAKPEFLLGGSLDYYFKDSLNFIKAEAEASLDLGIFFMGGIIHYKGVEGFFHQSITAPSLQYQIYYNGPMYWNNRFNNVPQFNNVSQTIIKAAFPITINNLRLKPFFQNTLYVNYLYFNSELKPNQLSDELNITHLGLDLEFPFKKFTFKNLTYINLSTDKVVYPVPLIYNFTTIAYKFKYAKVLDLEIGLDATIKSKYKALNYSALLNQFYKAGSFETWGVVVVDPYLQFKVNAVKIALRFQHVNQGLPNGGFYASPYYLYNPRSFYLHVNWPLFD
jgi:Putative porin